MKISIIGAGNVGATLAERILSNNLADVVLLDIESDLARGKALDLEDASPLMGYEAKIEGTGDYGVISGSDIVVMTAGLARKPGMLRDDLLSKNAAIVKVVAKKVREKARNAFFIMVTNPLDVMTRVAYHELGRDPKKVFGMAGNLDTARFAMLISKRLNVSFKDIDAMVLGSHGDTMVPLISQTRVRGKKLQELLQKKELEELLDATKKRGAHIVSLLKSGSAYYSPSAAIFDILQSIVKDEKRVIPCSVVLQGEYGITDCAIGVPAEIGKNGIEKVIELEISKNESELLQKSARAAKEALDGLSAKRSINDGRGK